MDFHLKVTRTANRVIEQRSRRQLTVAQLPTSGASVSVLFNDSETDSDTEIQEPVVSICGPGETSELVNLKIVKTGHVGANRSTLHQYYTPIE